MSDILSETKLSLADACLELPGRNGKHVNFSTVYRWAIRGILLKDGHRVKLEAVRLGGKWITSREALRRFVDRLTRHKSDRSIPAVGWGGTC